MAQTAVQQERVTAEQFWDRYAGSEARAELVNGSVIAMSPTGPVHGRTDRKLAQVIGPYVDEHELGDLVMNTGFLLAHDPDTVRGPDQAFISAAKISAHPPPERGWWEVIPDLAIEIVSPKDTPEQVQEKVAEYLRFGVRLVWVVDPRRREVRVYRPGEAAETVSAGGELDGEAVIPGFRAPLARLWE
jgi:Uma2 family endonuclease